MKLWNLVVPVPRSFFTGVLRAEGPANVPTTSELSRYHRYQSESIGL